MEIFQLLVNQPGLETKDMDDINTPLANDSHLQLGLITSLNTPNIILAEVYHHPHVYKSRRQGGQLRCLVEWRVLWSCPSSCFHELNGTFPLPQLVYLRVKRGHLKSFTCEEQRRQEQAPAWKIGGWACLSL